jgi:PIN domain nuclease of toxin-antitoxin system
MTFLLDTQLLVWSMTRAERVSADTRSLIRSSSTKPLYSVISIWEVAIKYSLHRPDFTVDPQQLKFSLDESGFRDLPIRCEHTFAIQNLPKIHKDPFDRLLIAQAIVEGVTLLTVDSDIAKYPGPVRLI